ncbi:YihY/virulence factor BrkB family protein [Phenylobacterium sp.]|uniref:YihY/virulence factor BrkB family protein n=1 Tax=Phenylobacterium sp. TaxID=1871053 RepID=UPI0035B417C0
MAIPRILERARRIEWDPIHWLRRALQIFGKALVRLWGRDVMLYVGGVSFFVMLAVFPGLAILIGLYSLLADPSRAAAEAEVVTRLMPAGARALFEAELTRLTHAPSQAVSTQSGLALVIGGYAAHRGFKALLAGLSFIHEEDRPRGFVGFNLLALGVLIAAFALMALVSALFLGLRLISATFDLRPLAGVSWLYSEWTWTSASLTLAMSLIYRFAMSSSPVAWRAAIAGGACATLLCLGASWASAFYVEQVAHLGATYGSVAAVVVFLIWLSWNVNAVFFGGALATEIEIALDTFHVTPPVPEDAQAADEAKPRLVSRSGS